jgi:hypothetical protein
MTARGFSGNAPVKKSTAVSVNGVAVLTEAGQSVQGLLAQVT